MHKIGNTLSDRTRSYSIVFGRFSSAKSGLRNESQRKHIKSENPVVDGAQSFYVSPVIYSCLIVVNVKHFVYEST